ncbi:MAG: DUF4097 domain-containing protein [Acidobacteriia bacterium]|nr:DUF4097 domain-containing protein [Terriglobia bacterium]
MPGVWAVVWALLLTMCSGGGLLASVVTPRAEFRQTFAFCPNGRVVIDNLYGDVRISGWDRDEVRVEAFKRGPGRLDDARIVVDSSSGLVSIRTLYLGSGEQPANVEYRISVPRGASLQDIHLVNGGLSLTGLTGPVKASAVNGDIRAEGLAGEADLSTVNGRLEIDLAQVNRSRPISLSSVNGSISLSIPSGAGASLEARNLSGGIQADLKRAWRALDGHLLRATLNRGGAPITLRSVNGEISIKAGVRGQESGLRSRKTAPVRLGS